MHWLGWIVVVLATIEAGWLAFDGAHALITGDYITPSSGAFAGQLGPWAKLVSTLGVDPRSTLMKVAHVLIGAVWLGVIATFIFRTPWSWAGMIACAALGLWYLPVGTLFSMTQIVLL